VGELDVENIGSIIKNDVEQSDSVFSVIVWEWVLLWVQTKSSLLEISVRSYIQEVVFSVIIGCKNAHASFCSDTKSLVCKRGNF
jgi:hypothetical protein